MAGDGSQQRRVSTGALDPGLSLGTQREINSLFFDDLAHARGRDAALEQEEDVIERQGVCTLGEKETFLEMRLRADAAGFLIAYLLRRVLDLAEGTQQVLAEDLLHVGSGVAA